MDNRVNLSRTARFSVMEPAGGGSQRWPARIAKILAVLLILFTFVSLDYPAGIPSGAEFDRSENGIYVAAGWSNSLVPVVDINSLVERLEAHGMRWVYADQGALDANGKLPHKNFMYAGRFVEYLHRARKPLTTLAWVSGSGAAGGGDLHLNDASVRSRIVDVCKYFVEQVGFDGVQLDIEPAISGDVGFLLLLDEVRAALGRKTLSVAAMKWTPVALSTGSMSLIPYSWDAGYYRQVAGKVDQVVLMTYDSAVPFANLYIKYAGWQTASVLDTLHDVTKCTVLVGIPTYDEHTVWHMSAENLGTGLQGVTESLSDMRKSGNLPVNFGGVALFAEWSTSPEEWALYDKFWYGGGVK